MAKIVKSDARRPRTRTRCGQICAKAVKILAIALLCLVGFIFLVIIGVSIWLTPDRLSDLAAREASRYFQADVKASNISYTLWKSFPRLDIHTDSVVVVSRTLRDIDPEIRKKLPADADFLGSISSFSGSINVIDLFLNRYVVHDVRVDGLNLNFVTYNDSIDNFNIFPSDSLHIKQIPYFTAEAVSLRNPGAISYYSAESGSKAIIRLHNLTLRRIGKRSANIYRLTLDGRLSASSQGLDILNRFPFAMAGDLTLRFRPFGVTLTDYGIDLGKLRSKLSMKIGMGDNPGIDNFDYRISVSNLMGLLGYIPPRYLRSLQGLVVNTPVTVSARFTTAWQFLSPYFPSMRVDFNVPSGNISYTVSPAPGSKGRSSVYTLSHSPIGGTFLFDGRHPEKSRIELPRFDIRSNGIDLSVEADVTRLTSRPLITASIAASADLRQVLESLAIALPSDIPANASGHLNIDTDLQFSLSSFNRAALDEGLLSLRADGKINASDLNVSLPSLAIKGSAGNFNADISASADALTMTSIRNPKTDLKIRVARIFGSSPFGNAGIDNLRLNTSSTFAGDASSSVLIDKIPVSVELDADNLQFADKKDSISLNLKSLKLSDILKGSSGQSLKKALADGMRLKAGEVNVSAGNSSFLLKDLSLTGTLAPCKGNLKNCLPNHAITRPSATSETQAPDAMIPPHTPELITPHIPADIRNFLCKYSFTANLKTRRIDFSTPAFPSGNHLSDIDISLSDDRLRLNNASMLIQDTRARASGAISGLRNFLLLPASTSNPLDIDARIELDTVNINNLAKAYVLSKGGAANIPSHPSATADDSIALLIPRNINARICASARETIYTNLHLYNLLADIHAADGIARIPELNISSDFGRASLNMIYDSSDIDNLNLSANVDISDVNVVNFFKNFHTLLLMMPQMKNLSGILSANASLSASIFPDMYLNTPSARADITVRGRELKVHQNSFIRHITKMMLIRTDDDIKIHNINVHAEAHDNLLQLDPFYFEFDRYKLRMEGINNFNGNLYYHIALLKSPVPWPFSVNIEGLFRHPKLRFGGPKYNIRRGEQITTQIQENNNFNLVAVFKNFMREFICKAAESAEND